MIFARALSRRRPSITPLFSTNQIGPIYLLHNFQVVIVGNGAVGKSSMIQKYCKGIFTAEYKKTIGVDFLEKRIW